MEEKLPLFLTLYDPLAIYVINNEIIGCEMTSEKVNPNIVMRSYSLGHGFIAPDQPFLFLKRMYQIESLRKFFPEQLRHHFDSFIDKELPTYDSSFMRSFGYGDKKFSLYFNLEIDETSKEFPIILHNFSYEDKLLDYKIRLSGKDAFHLLANICTNAHCNGVLQISKGSIDKLLYREIIRPKRNFHEYGYTKFTVDYLKYLLENFRNKELTPSYILQFSGTRLLMYLSKNKQISNFIKQIITELSSLKNLSRSKKIAYYALLKLLSKYSKSVWSSIKSSNELLNKFQQLETEIQVSFPHISVESDELTQEEYEKTFMPIFWFQEQPIEIYVINNKLLGGFPKSGAFNNGYSTKAFYLLSELYNNPYTKKILPKSLEHFFEESKVKEIKPVSSLYVYLLGWNDPNGYTTHMDLDIAILEEQDKDVILKDFTFDGMPMDIQIPLTSYEAFILFANICTSKLAENYIGIVSANDLCWNFEFLIKNNKLEHWDDLYQVRVQKMIDNHPKEARPIVEKNYLENLDVKLWIPEFSLYYLKYLREQLLAEKITPLEILRLSGAAVLMLLAIDNKPIENFIEQILEELKDLNHLSFNRQIMYYTFLELCKDKLYDPKKEKQILNRIDDFYKNNYAILHSIESKLDKNYPRNDRQLLDWLLSFKDKESENTKNELIIQLKEQEKMPIDVFFHFYKFQLMIKENELVLFRQQTTPGFGIKTFKLIRELYNSKITRKAIPKIFHH
ncbi:MAG: hypothetical protein ACTSPI_12985, partial [Candidatus Heimdallarchaeaceae archaeon]